MTKKDLAIIAGPIVGGLAYSAVIISTVLIVDKVKERRAKKAQQKDVITELMEDAQKK